MVSNRRRMVRAEPPPVWDIDKEGIQRKVRLWASPNADTVRSLFWPWAESDGWSGLYFWLRLGEIVEE